MRLERQAHRRSISREFLNSNGAPKAHRRARASCPQKAEKTYAGSDWKEKMASLVSDLNVCSQKGLVERFDSTIGAGTVLMPFGGERQLTPAQAMAAKIPVLHGRDLDLLADGLGLQPRHQRSRAPTTARICAVIGVRGQGGGRRRGCAARCWLTFQEYFERTTAADRSAGASPWPALLGALEAQLELGVAAIGGKDSMSGSFEELDVPPDAGLLRRLHRPTHSTSSPPNASRRATNVALLRATVIAKTACRSFDAVRAVFDRVEELMRKGEPSSTRPGRSASAAWPRACSRWRWATGWASGLNATCPMKQPVRAAATAAFVLECDGARRGLRPAGRDHGGLCAVPVGGETVSTGRAAKAL